MTKHKKKRITIKGKSFMADVKMIPLLRELNKLGLITYSHCVGCKHNGNHRPFVVIQMESIDFVEVRRIDGEQHLVISWCGPGSPKGNRPSGRYKAVKI